MSALLQTPDLALFVLGGVCLLMLVVGLLWRSRSPREDARAKVRRDVLVPIELSVARVAGQPSIIDKSEMPNLGASSHTPAVSTGSPVRMSGPARAATSATAARQAAKSALMAGDVRIAADAYRGAGLVDEAVNLLVGVLGAPAEGAELLVKAGRHERAAELFQSAGKKREAAQQWAQVARKSSEPGKLFDSIAALDWSVAMDLAAELGKDPNHPDARAIKAASALLRTVDSVSRTSNLGDDEELDDSAESLSEEEAEALASDATRVMVWRDEDGKQTLESLNDQELPPQRASYPSIVETPFEDDEPLDLMVLADEAVTSARVGPTVEQLSAYVKASCTTATVEMHYRVAVAMIARGAWNRALALLEGIEAVAPGVKDVAAKSAAIALWRKRLGSRRFVAAGRYELAGEWRRHRHAVSFRGYDHTEKREVMLHRLGAVRSTEAAIEACPTLRTFGTLLHPNVTRVYDVFLDDHGRVMVATELSDASSLKERIARAPLQVVEALRVAVEIASACEHLHARGLGMDELYPGCVSSVPGGLVKLEPLGFGALLDGDGDHARRVAPYLAPEGHEPHDERCTVFSLGATLLHAITQRPPRIDEKVTIDSLKDLKVPGAFATIIARAMAREPSARFPSSNGMRLTLRSLLRQVHGRASQARISVKST